MMSLAERAAMVWLLGLVLWTDLWGRMLLAPFGKGLWQD